MLGLSLVSVHPAEHRHTLSGVKQSPLLTSELTYRRSLKRTINKTEIDP